MYVQGNYWTAEESLFDFREGQNIFPFLDGVQIGSETHPASYPMVTGGSFPGVKRPGRAADNSPPPSAGVKNACSYASMAQCLTKHMDFYVHFYITLT
jgi:hypothetical protein